MVEYQPEKCAYCQAETWCELRSNGRWQCRGCKAVLFFRHVLYAPLGYQLLLWAERDLRAIYGKVRPEDGRRQYKRAFLSEPKKNGKSFFVGGVPIYGLTVENVWNPKIYGGAAAKDQAAIVFQSAAMLVNANPDLKPQLKVLPSVKRIVRRDGNGFYAVLAADGQTSDGIEPYIAIRDELHRWKNAGAESLRDAMTKGQISQTEPLDIVITTAGAEYESPLWLEEYEHAKQVQVNPSLDPELYVSIYEPDIKRIHTDSDYWKSREARVAANPSHEDNGGFLKDEAIAAEMYKAVNNPRQRSKYFRFNLNVPVKALEDPVIDMNRWQECGGDVDLRTWEEFDVERLISEWSLAGQACYAGVDASWRTDLTCVSLVFPPFEGGEQISVVPFFFMPAERVPELERICRVPFSAWIEQGMITATRGSAIDLQAVMERIFWARQRFDLRSVPYDRANFSIPAIQLQNDGIECVEIPQTFLGLGYATKVFLGAIAEGQLRHGNHPVANWMASCLQLQYDQKDNCQPSKPMRLKSSKRIDFVQATVNAFTQLHLELAHPPAAIEVW